MVDEEDQRYQKDLRRKVSEALRNAQIEQQKKELMKQFLEAGAYERIMNIKVSNPELYEQLVNLIISLAQINRLKGKMSDEQLRSILGRITYRKEPTIEFKHK